MSSTYASKWPVPPPSEQPPKKPLRARRRDAREYECGLLLNTPTGTTCKRTHSILPREFPKQFDLHAVGAGFADPAFDDANAWVQLRLDVPLRDVFIDEKYLEEYDQLPVPKLRPTEAGPILSVSHTLDVVLTCTYDLSEGDAAEDLATEELRLTLPLSFVRVPRRNATPPVVDFFSAQGGEAVCAAPPAVPCPVEMRQAAFPPASLPYAQALPAYSQLFYANGSLREDPTPLPRYTRDPRDAEDPPPPFVLPNLKQTSPSKPPMSSAPTISGLDSSA